MLFRSTPTFPKLTPEEFAELLERERAKGNPLALFAGSCIDPNDPEDKEYWEAIYEHRRQYEKQLEEMELREESENRKQK